MAFTGRPATVGRLVAAGIGIAQRQAPLIGAFAAVNLAVQVIEHFEQSAKIGGVATVGLVTMILAIAGFIVHVLILRAILLRERLMTAAMPLLWGTYIGVSIVMGLAICLGLLLLVVPGIFLILRWYLAPYFVLARGLGFDAALAASRDATDGHRGAMLGVLVLAGLAYLVVFGLIMLAAGGFLAYGTMVWYSALGMVSLLALVLLGAASLALTIGIFSCLVDGVNQFDDVFG